MDEQNVNSESAVIDNNNQEQDMVISEYQPDFSERAIHNILGESKFSDKIEDKIYNMLNW